MDAQLWRGDGATFVDAVLAAVDAVGDPLVLLEPRLPAGAEPDEPLLTATGELRMVWANASAARSPSVPALGAAVATDTSGVLGLVRDACLGVATTRQATRVEAVAVGDARSEWYDVDIAAAGPFVVVCWRDVSTRVAAQHAERASRERATEAERLAQLATWELDVATDTLWLSELYAEWLGLSGPTTLDLASLRAAASAGGATTFLDQILALLDAGEPFEIDQEVHHRDGAPLRVVVRGERRGDRWVGTVQNVTTLRALQDLVEQLRAAEERVRSGRDALELALDAGRMGHFVWDARTDRVWWDARLEALFGLEPGTFGGTFEEYMAQLHPDDRELAGETLARTAAAGGGPYAFEHRVVLSDGRVRWIEGRGLLVVGDDGATLEARGVALDVSERKAAEFELAAAEARLRLLSEASAVLMSSLDTEVLLRALGALLVPAIADACEFDLLEERKVRRYVVAVDDAFARRREAAPLPPLDAHPIRQAVAGRAQMIDAGTDADLFGDPSDPASAASAGICSAVVVPVTARGRPIGALSLGRTDRLPGWSAADVALASELATRTSMALENGALFAQQRAVAERLQRSLLPPELVAPTWLEVAARYRAAEDGLDVGGDWYDLLTGDGTVTVTVGDVVGHGVEALVLMNRIRTSLHAFLAAGSSPGPALERLDAIRRGEAGSDFTTVSVLRVGRTGNLRVASAGHLPALVCRPDGTASYVTARPTPPIGLRYVGPRPEASASIEPGTWLAVFTDGLVEQRGEPIDDGLERVRLLATALAGHDPDTVADRLLAALVGEHPRDDVALVVVRFAG